MFQISCGPVPSRIGQSGPEDGAIGVLKRTARMTPLWRVMGSKPFGAYCQNHVECSTGICKWGTHTHTYRNIHYEKYTHKNTHTQQMQASKHRENTHAHRQYTHRHTDTHTHTHRHTHTHIYSIHTDTHHLWAAVNPSSLTGAATVPTASQSNPRCQRHGEQQPIDVLDILPFLEYSSVFLIPFSLSVQLSEALQTNLWPSLGVTVLESRDRDNMQICLI